MKRGIVMICVLWPSLLLSILIVKTQALMFENSMQSTAQESLETVEITLPYRMQETNLVLLGMGAYEGLYYEDGSGEPIVDVAAALIMNCSDVLLSRGSVIMEQGGRQLIFEFQYLAPGKTVFVPEYHKERYRNEKIISCDSWSVVEESRSYEHDLSVVPQGMGTLVVTNLTNTQLTDVCIFYRALDIPTGIQIGGKCGQSVPIRLEPYEQVCLMPPRYSCIGNEVITCTYQKRSSLP